MNDETLSETEPFIIDEVAPKRTSLARISWGHVQDREP
jgi:hypothetical protein